MHRNVKTNISSTFTTLSNFKIFTSLLYSYKKKKTKKTKSKLYSNDTEVYGAPFVKKII